MIKRILCWLHARKIKTYSVYAGTSAAFVKGGFIGEMKIEKVFRVVTPTGKVVCNCQDEEKAKEIADHLSRGRIYEAHGATEGMVHDD